MSQTTTRPRSLAADPALQAFVLLRAGFAVAPVLFGLDKFLGLTADWTTHLWPPVATALPLDPAAIMLAVGTVEITAGILVALRPRIGAPIVAAWLAVVIINLLLLGDAYDLALRDVGLLLGAIALARLATAYPHAGLGGRNAG